MALNAAERSSLLLSLFEAGVSAVSGFEATSRYLKSTEIPNKVSLVALGKAADAMASGAISVLGDKLVSGLLVTKHGHLSEQLRTDSRLTCREAGHPVPDQASLLAGSALKNYVQAVPPDHLLVFLVSGGTSALVEELIDGLSLSELKDETDKLLASGVPIGEMNVHRRTLSQIKGGKLSAYIQCPVLQLLISDVPGDKPADIGSGLLVPDATTGMHEALPVWNQIQTHIVASSSIAQAAAADMACQKGLTVRQASGSLHGDMPDVVERVTGVLTRKNAEKGVYIWGGEPTIVLPENPGRGGRNQHLALALTESISTQENLSVLVCGTDGSDGPTEDAGAIVFEKTYELAAQSDIDIRKQLNEANAGACLDALSALVTTGPTGTNVMDLAIAILE